MATQSRAQMLKELLPGLNALYGDEYKTYEQQHTFIYELDTSKRSFEEEVKLSGYNAAPVKPEGQPISYDIAQESYTSRYVHETIALGFSLTEEALEDNLYVSLAKRNVKALVRAMAHTKQVKGAALLNTGFDSFTSGDGQYLMDTDHPLVGGGTQRNRPSAAVDLNETALENAVIDIAAYVDERALIIAARPRRLIVPSSLQFVATRILESQLRVATADNDPNALRTNGSIPEGYRVNNYLTDTDAWFIITDIPNGMKYFDRVKESQSMDGDFNTGNVRYKCRARYSFGVSDYLGIYGSPGST